MAKAIIFDLDMTLVDTSVAVEFRNSGNWSNAKASIPNMNVYYRLMYYLLELTRLNVPVAVVSNSAEPYCQSVLEALNVSYSDIGIVKSDEELPNNKRVYVIGYHSTEHHKPDAEPVNKALSVMSRYKKYRPSDVIAFGDSEDDVTAYINAGIPESNIYRVAWYTHENISETRAGHVLTDIEEIDDVIAGVSHECLADVSRDYVISFSKNGDNLHYLEDNGNDITLEANRTEYSVRAFQKTVYRDRKNILSLVPYVPNKYDAYAFGLLPEMKQSVIDLKNGVSEAVEAYAKRFANVIALEDAYRHTSYDTIALISVPSSKVEGDTNSPIKECISQIVNMLNSRGFKAVDLSNTFVRNTDIRSAHDAARNGLERPSVSEQLDTITYNAPELKGKVLYFILDDVTTQGRIMNDVCKKKMVDEGIDKADIVCLVAGKTMGPNMNVTEDEKKIKKYYTLTGFDGVYESYEEASKEWVSKKITNDYPLAFSTREDAEAFRTGKWDEYLKANLKKCKIDADAIIYADGSVNTEKAKTGGYGIVIFFKSGELYCESAQLSDIENGKFRSVRYDLEGNQIEESVVEYPVVKEAKEGFVQSGNNEAGEFEAARRALDICFNKKGAKKVVLVYDSETIEKRYNNELTFKTTSVSHTAYFYGSICKDIKERFGDKAVEFIHVESHRGVPKGGKPAKPFYKIDEMEFIHAVYNDLADAMAKSEAGIGEVSRAENVNIAHAIPETYFKVMTKDVKNYQANKMKVRELVKAILDKEWLRPEF